MGSLIGRAPDRRATRPQLGLFHYKLPAMELFEVLQSLRISVSPCSAPARIDLDTNEAPGQDLEDGLVWSSGNASRKPQSLQLLGPVTNSPQFLLLYQQTIRPLLAASLPSTAISDEMKAVTLESCSTAWLKLLIYAMTNNFPCFGREDLLPTQIWSYLQPSIRQLRRDTPSAHCARSLLARLPSLRPLAEMLFRCAIEAGDTGAVEQLLDWDEAKIDIDAIVCQGETVFEDQQDMLCEGVSTPLERCLRIGATSTARLLIDRGADVRKSQRIDFESPQGALECALFPRRPHQIDMAVFRRIWKAGGKFNLVRDGGPLGDHLVTQLVNKIVSSVNAWVLWDLIDSGSIDGSMQKWSNIGLFHLCVATLDCATLNRLFKYATAHGLDLNRGCRMRVTASRTGDVPVAILDRGSSDLLQLVDLAALKGDMILLQSLIGSGGIPSTFALPIALRYDRVEIASALLRCASVDVHAYDPSLKTTPYVEAVRRGHSQFYDILERDYRYMVSFSSPTSPLGHFETQHGLDMECWECTLSAIAEHGQPQHVKSLLREGCHMVEFGNLSAWKSIFNLAVSRALTLAIRQRKKAMTYMLLSEGSRWLTPLDPWENATESDFLLAAVEQRDEGLFYRLLEYLPLAPDPCFDYGPPLWHDPHKYQSAILAKAIEWGVDPIINVIVAAGQGLQKGLVAAVEVQHEDFVEKLLSAGAQVQDCLASVVSQVDVDPALVRHLVHHGASVNIEMPTQNPSNPSLRRTYLATAAARRNMPLFRELLNQGAYSADIDAWKIAMELNSPLLLCLTTAFIQQHPSGDAKFLVRLLPMAVEQVCDPVIKLCLARQSRLSPYYSPKYHLVEKNALHLVDMRDNCLHPLDTAIQKGLGLDLIQDLVARMHDLDLLIYRERGPPNTPLLRAVESGSIEVIKLLLDASVRINFPATRGLKRTPLQRAAESGRQEIVEYLLHRGADVNAPPAVHSGATALQLAASVGALGIVQLLLEHGADIHAPPAEIHGRTALAGAAENGRFDTVHFFLHNWQFDENECKKGIEYAKRSGHGAVADLVESSLISIQNQDLSAQKASNEHSFYDQEFESEVDTYGSNSFSGNICPLCDKSFSRTTTLKRHQATLHGNFSTKQRFFCGECDMAFDRKDLLSRHQKKHEKAERVKCPACGKFLSRKDYVSQHLKICKHGAEILRNEEYLLPLEIGMEE